MSACQVRFFATILAVLTGILRLEAVAADDPPGARAAALGAVDPQVAALVEQLGDDDFATRQRAQAQLSRMGLEAFDALVAAQHHKVMEVQMRARFLVKGMNVRWYDESDPPEVARLLKSYGEQDDKERETRIDRLGAMEDVASLTALCRLVRYEVSPILSKHAALLILHRDDPKTPQQREQAIGTITTGIGASKRPAVAWLQIYIRALNDPSSTVAEWQAVVDKEQEVLALQPVLSSRQVVRDLFRYEIKLFKQLGRDQDAIALMRRSIDLLDGDPAQITEIIDWLVHRKAWDVVLEVGNRYPHIVADDAALMYLRAHAHLQLKQPEKAKELATAALALRPNQLDEHLKVATQLGDKWGMFDYSEHEYREIIRQAAPGSFHDFKARFQLSEQLHDQGRELPAAEFLQPAVDLMFPADDETKGDVARDIARRAQRDPDSTRSRMHYFYSRHHHEQKDFVKEKASLAKAMDADGTDADVLIAQFRLPNLDAEERTEIIEKIDETAREFREQVAEFRAQAQDSPSEQERSRMNVNMAIACNQLAWLVCNTRGDFDEALKCSQQSLEIRPDEGGYWDTLGRCYYAKGDYENAVKQQTQAVKLQPHSGQIRKQLELFRRALKDQKAKSP
jgi:tetratricopeptide (TPR) repeat protein